MASETQSSILHAYRQWYKSGVVTCMGLHAGASQVLVLSNQPASPSAATGGRKLLQASSNDVTLQITPTPDQVLP